MKYSCFNKELSNDHIMDYYAQSQMCFRLGLDSQKVEAPEPKDIPAYFQAALHVESIILLCAKLKNSGAPGDTILELPHWMEEHVNAYTDEWQIFQKTVEHFPEKLFARNKTNIDPRWSASAITYLNAFNQRKDVSVPPVDPKTLRYNAVLHGLSLPLVYTSTKVLNLSHEQCQTLYDWYPPAFLMCKEPPLDWLNQHDIRLSFYVQNAMSFEDEPQRRYRQFAKMCESQGKQIENIITLPLPHDMSSNI